MTTRPFGAIDEQRSGNYRARYTGPDGRRYSAGKAFPTKAAARAWLKATQRDILGGRWKPPVPAPATPKKEAATSGLTVGQWVETWLDLRARDLKPSTLQGYRRVLDARLLRVSGQAGLLRDIPLGSVKRHDIAVWLDALTMQFGYQRTNKAAYTRLKTALRAAVDRELLEVDPCTVRFKPPPTKRKELPTTEELTAITEQLPDRYKIVAVLTFFHGLRLGEALGLRRCDIVDDGQRLVLQIRGTAYRKEGVGMVRMEGAKTAAGNRDVPVFPAYTQLVRDHLKQFVGSRADSPVCSSTGGLIIMDTTYRSRLAIARQKAGVTKPISPHYGRVWLITALVEAGLTIPAVGEILGQRDLRTITEVYMRTSDVVRNRALDAVNQQLDQFGG